MAPGVSSSHRRVTEAMCEAGLRDCPGRWRGLISVALPSLIRRSFPCFTGSVGPPACFGRKHQIPQSPWEAPEGTGSLFSGFTWFSPIMFS